MKVVVAFKEHACAHWMSEGFDPHPKWDVAVVQLQSLFIQIGCVVSIVVRSVAGFSEKPKESS